MYDNLKNRKYVYKKVVSNYNIVKYDRKAAIFFGSGVKVVITKCAYNTPSTHIDKCNIIKLYDNL